MNAEVAVIGLGTMGSMAAWQLSSRGVSVLGFEQFGIGHDRSAHAGGSRRFTVISNATKEIPLKRESYRLFRNLERETGQQLLSNGGTLTIGHPDSPRIKEVLSTIEKYSLPHEILEENEAMERYPMHRLLPGEIMVFDKLGGVLRPEQTVITAVNRARKLGAKIYSHTPIKDIQSDSSGVTIVSENNETFRVNKVVITTGPWANKLFPDLNKVFTVQRRLMTWFIPETPALFHESKFPNFGRTSDGISLVGAPSIDGRLVRVNDRTTTPESVAKVEMKDADDLCKNVSVDELVNVKETVKRFLPNLNPDPVNAQAFMDGFTTDGLPIVGSLNGKNNVILVCGFSARGFSQSPAMGEIAADLAMNNKPSYSIDHLSPRRFSL
ncbi:N-methyl-L-tryptophan oxidase [Virgibacillus oceani]